MLIKLKQKKKLPDIKNELQHQQWFLAETAFSVVILIAISFAYCGSRKQFQIFFVGL